jgi:hypothetical protein
MRAPAWVLLAIVVPFIAASPILVERDFISDTITSLGQILSSVIGLAQNVLTLSLLTSTAYITPAASGGKRIAITGNKYLVTGLDAYLGIPFAEPCELFGCRLPSPNADDQ